MKTNLILLFLLFPIGISAQEKACFVICGRGRDCSLKIIEETKDTIRCVVETDCDIIQYDPGKNVTWLVYSKDTSRLLEMVTFKDSLMHGENIVNYHNGKTKSKAFYENGIQTGFFISYYEDGRIERIGFQKDHGFEGETYKYWDNGNVAAMEITYDLSVLREYVCFWDPEGNSISEKEFRELWYCH